MYDEIWKILEVVEGSTFESGDMTSLVWLDDSCISGCVISVENLSTFSLSCLARFKVGEKSVISAPKTAIMIDETNIPIVCLSFTRCVPSSLEEREFEEGHSFCIAASTSLSYLFFSSLHFISPLLWLLERRPLRFAMQKQSNSSLH